MKQQEHLLETVQLSPFSDEETEAQRHEEQATKADVGLSQCGLPGAQAGPACNFSDYIFPTH